MARTEDAEGTEVQHPVQPLRELRALRAKPVRDRVRGLWMPRIQKGRPRMARRSRREPAGAAPAQRLEV